MFTFFDKEMIILCYNGDFMYNLLITILMCVFI